MIPGWHSLANLCSMLLWQRVENPQENSIAQPFLFAFVTEACVSCNKQHTHICISRSGSTVCTWLHSLEKPWLGIQKKCKKDLFFLQKISGIWFHLKLQSRAGKLTVGKQFFYLFFPSFSHRGKRALGVLMFAYCESVVSSAPSFLFKNTIVLCFCEFTVWWAHYASYKI